LEKKGEVIAEMQNLGEGRAKDVTKRICDSPSWKKPMTVFQERARPTTPLLGRAKNGGGKSREPPRGTRRNGRCQERSWSKPGSISWENKKQREKGGANRLSLGRVE